ncbi:MAG: DNA polymerase III subunit alpha [Anaerolineales bacterium]|jgi:DNA polymerase-3 subunit alpha
MTFAHLHVHSEYSLLDGLGKVNRLVARAKELNMPALALTDHGTLFGVIEFYHTAKAAGIRPIIGVEAYLASRSMMEKDARLDREPFHLLLLAENDAGYHNLLQIATAAQLQGFYYRPRIDHEYLASHSEGLICTSGCLAAEIPRAIAEGRETEAKRLLDWYFGVFGRDHFYLELQRHEIPELDVVNRRLLELAPRFGARLVATNDVHYVLAEDSVAHDILLCIQTGSLVSDPNRMRMSDASYYLRSPEEMRSLFAEVPEALSNTLEIAERCDVDLDFKGYHLPSFPLPPDQSAQDYLMALCEEGLQQRYGEKSGDPSVRERLRHELEVIHAMNFDTYFLIVWDLCRFAREQGIWYNARGSAAGSLVAFALGITLVDPLDQGLLFERFLNPGRVSMPDIDLDFQDDLRARVLEYAVERYGRDRVAQIITFGTMAARAAVRDVGRVLDIPLSEVDRVAKLIPYVPGKPVTLREALADIGPLKEVYESTDYIRNLIDTAVKLEGVIRNAGTHAAGVVITDRPLIEYLPLHRPTHGTLEDNPVGVVTQFEMQVLEELGLLKVDFLGLATLTVMQRACELISERRGIDLNLENLPVDDPAIYELLGRGDVAGVFQVEGSGMRRYLMEMQPKGLANVIAMIALYRPGPIDFIPTYIRRMHGEETVEYRHPDLEPILRETYGIPIYQEQLMRAAIQLAGYTASEADDLRRAVAKKKAGALQAHRKRFVEGCGNRGIDHRTAEAIYDDWEGFARYGFNKAHAADYGVICAKTAYLKAQFPVEFMTALLSVTKAETEKVALYIADARHLGIEVRPPDINFSQWDFAIEDLPAGGTAIRYGLGAIKNVGEAAIQGLIEARSQGGPFRNLDDFVRRIDLRKVGRRALESLAKVGALDALGNRVSILDAMDRLLSASAQQFRAADVGQLSLFAGSTAGSIDVIQLAAPAQPVPQRTLLEWERELLGLYVSDHPLSPYLADLQRIVTHFSGEWGEELAGQPVRVAGLVTQMRAHQTRNGHAMGFVSVEDIQGVMEVTVFPSLWSKVKDWLHPDLIVVVEGKAEAGGSTPRVLADKITTDLKATEPTKRTAAGLTKTDLPAQPQTAESCPTDQIEAGGLASTDASPVGSFADEPLEVVSSPDLFLEDGSLGDMPKSVVAPAVPVTVAAGGDLSAASSSLEGLPLPVPHDPMTLAAVLREKAKNPLGLAHSLPPGPLLVTVSLCESGDRNRDVRRMRAVHGLLASYPGQDRFSFRVIEGSRTWVLEFPNDTTGYCEELEVRLLKLLGPGAIDVRPWRVQ